MAAMTRHLRGSTVSWAAVATAGQLALLTLALTAGVSPSARVLVDAATTGSINRRAWDVAGAGAHRHSVHAWLPAAPSLRVTPPVAAVTGAMTLADRAAWDQGIQNGVLTPPVVAADGTIFIVSSSGWSVGSDGGCSIVAAHPPRFHTTWRRDLGCTHANDVAGPMLVVLPGATDPNDPTAYVVVVASAGVVLTLDPATGDERGRFDAWSDGDGLGGPSWSVPLASAWGWPGFFAPHASRPSREGFFAASFSVGADGSVALDWEIGAPRGSAVHVPTEQPSGIAATELTTVIPDVGSGSGLIVTAATNTTDGDPSLFHYALVALDIGTGAPVWRHDGDDQQPLRGPVGSIDASADGSVVVVSFLSDFNSGGPSYGAGVVQALDTATGAVVWQWRPPPPQDTVAWPRQAGVSPDSPDADSAVSIAPSVAIATAHLASGPAEVVLTVAYSLAVQAAGMRVVALDLADGTLVWNILRQPSQGYFDSPSSQPLHGDPSGLSPAGSYPFNIDIWVPASVTVAAQSDTVIVVAQTSIDATVVRLSTGEATQFAPPLAVARSALRWLAVADGVMAMTPSTPDGVVVSRCDPAMSGSAVVDTGAAVDANASCVWSATAGALGSPAAEALMGSAAAPPRQEAQLRTSPWGAGAPAPPAMVMAPRWMVQGEHVETLGATMAVGTVSVDGNTLFTCATAGAPAAADSSVFGSTLVVRARSLRSTGAPQAMSVGDDGESGESGAGDGIGRVQWSAELEYADGPCLLVPRSDGTALVAVESTVLQSADDFNTRAQLLSSRVLVVLATDTGAVVSRHALLTGFGSDVGATPQVLGRYGGLLLLATQAAVYGFDESHLDAPLWAFGSGGLGIGGAHVAYPPLSVFGAAHGRVVVRETLHVGADAAAFCEPHDDAAQYTPWPNEPWRDCDWSRSSVATGSPLRTDWATVAVLNASTGQLLWRHWRPAGASSADVHSGGGMDGAAAAGSGTAEASLPLGADVTRSGAVVATFSDNAVVAWDVADGTELWAVNDAAALATDAADAHEAAMGAGNRGVFFLTRQVAAADAPGVGSAGEVVVVPTLARRGGGLLAFDAADGSLVWQRASEEVDTRPVSEINDLGFDDTLVPPAGQRARLGDGQMQDVVVAARSGGGGNAAAVVLAAFRRWGESGDTHALDAGTGSLVWRMTVDDMGLGDLAPVEFLLLLPSTSADAGGADTATSLATGSSSSTRLQFGLAAGFRGHLGHGNAGPGWVVLGCVPHSSGEFCQACEDGFFRLRGDCVECPDAPAGLLVVTALLFVLVVLVLARDSGTAEKPAAGAGDSSANGGGAATVTAPGATAAPKTLTTETWRPPASLTGPLVQLVHFCQVLSLTGDLDIHIPPLVSFAWIMRLLSFLQVDLDLVGPECVVGTGAWQFSDSIATTVLFPIVLAVAIVLVAAAAHGMRMAAKGEAFASPKLHHMRTVASRALLSIAIVSFVPVLSKSLRAFDCTSINPSESRLDGDRSILCGSAQWQSQYVPLGVIGVIYAAVVVAVLIYASARIGTLGALAARGRALSAADVTFAARFGLLVEQYRTGFAAYEVWNLARKAVLAASVYLLSEWPAHVTWSIVSFSVAWLPVPFLVRPFNTPARNYLEGWMYVAFVATAFLMRLGFQGDTEAMSAEARADADARNEAVGAALTALVVLTGVLVAVTMVVDRLATKRARAANIRAGDATSGNSGHYRYSAPKVVSMSWLHSDPIPTNDVAPMDAASARFTRAVRRVAWPAAALSLVLAVVWWVVAAVQYTTPSADQKMSAAAIAFNVSIGLSQVVAVYACGFAMSRLKGALANAVALPTPPALARLRAAKWACLVVGACCGLMAFPLWLVAPTDVRYRDSGTTAASVYAQNLVLHLVAEVGVLAFVTLTELEHRLMRADAAPLPAAAAAGGSVSAAGALPVAAKAPSTEPGAGGQERSVEMQEWK